MFYTFYSIFVGLFFITLTQYLQVNCCASKSAMLSSKSEPYCENRPPAKFERKYQLYAPSDASMIELYRATMILSGAGDAISYHRGRWEFEKNGSKIHDELYQMGGIRNIAAEGSDWIVSDDSVMHIATGEALVEFLKSNSHSMEDLYITIAKYYKESMNDMLDRSAGVTCIETAKLLNPHRPNGYKIPFNKRGGGCGASMRSMCIGLLYWRDDDLKNLIAVSVESGRMTHNHPTGYLGAVAGALFTSLAIKGVPANQWGRKLMDILPLVWDFVVERGRDVEENREQWYYFKEKWEKYLDLRQLTDGFSNPRFPAYFGVNDRDKFYAEISFSGWGGASGHDAPMIAYDALLGGGRNWEKMADRGFFHGGDSDSTAVMVAAWFGALYGFDTVPSINYQNLEYKDRMERIAVELYNYANHVT